MFISWVLLSPGVQCAGTLLFNHYLLLFSGFIYKRKHRIAWVQEAREKVMRREQNKGPRKII